MTRLSRRILAIFAIAALNVQFAWLFVEPWAARIYVPIAQTLLFVGVLYFLVPKLSTKRRSAPARLRESTTPENPTLDEGEKSLESRIESTQSTPTFGNSVHPASFSPVCDGDVELTPDVEHDESIKLADTPPASHRPPNSVFGANYLDEVMEALEHHDPEETFAEEALHLSAEMDDQTPTGGILADTSTSKETR